MGNETYSLAQVERVFEEITRGPNEWVPDEQEIARLRGRFLAVGPWKPDHPFTMINVLKGLTQALHREQWGLWFDHTEDYLIQENSNRFIDSRLGRPDAYWFDPDNYTKFEWDGARVGHGLKALDQWMVINQAEHREREQLPMSPGFRLIEIDTGSDDLLSMACYDNYVEGAIGALSALGVRSRRQTAGGFWTQ